jgi:hypothetical protein
MALTLALAALLLIGYSLLAINPRDSGR